MFSNKYIYIYTTIMVVVVAALLALAATMLKPFHERNAKVETMQNILKAAGIASQAENAAEMYAAYIQEEWTVNTKGEIVARYDADGRLIEGDSLAPRAFGIEMKKALTEGEKALFPVYLCRKGETLGFIMPLYGKGLWGPIWGYITLQPDMKTVSGVSFRHQGETPGLGSEIAEESFQAPFAGKQIFDVQGQFTSITVQKGGIKQFKGDPVHAVDAISGGTLTSNGVSDMLRSCLTCYLPFFERMQNDSALLAVVGQAEGASASAASADARAATEDAETPAPTVAAPASTPKAASQADNDDEPDMDDIPRPRPVQPIENRAAKQDAPAHKQDTPSRGEQPVKPAQPTQPTHPAQPEKNDAPQPSTPAQPSQPQQPVEPVQPKVVE